MFQKLKVLANIEIIIFITAKFSNDGLCSNNDANLATWYVNTLQTTYDVSFIKLFVNNDGTE